MNVAGRILKVVAVGALICGQQVVPSAQDSKAVRRRVVTQRADLGKAELWEKTRADLVIPGAAGRETKIEQVVAKTAAYHSMAYRTTFLFVLIADRHSGYIHIAPASQSFYISDKTEVWACFVGPGTLVMMRSYFRRAADSGSETLTIERFLAEVQDQDLARTDAARVLVPFGMGVPPTFFLSGSNAASSQSADPTIGAIDVTEGVLRLDLVSPAARHKGTFWIDLGTQRLRRSVVDSKEVFRAK